MRTLQFKWRLHQRLEFGPGSQPASGVNVSWALRNGFAHILCSVVAADDDCITKQREERGHKNSIDGRSVAQNVKGIRRLLCGSTCYFVSTLANRISEIQKEGMEKFQTCTHVICSMQLLHFYQKIAIQKSRTLQTTWKYCALEAFTNGNSGPEIFADARNRASNDRIRKRGIGLSVTTRQTHQEPAEHLLRTSCWLQLGAFRNVAFQRY